MILNNSLNFLSESKNLSKSLVLYIKNNIIKLYNKFDAGHRPSHAYAVINFSMKLQKLIKNTDPDIVFTVAAYHDSGLIYGDRKLHHIKSGEIVHKDKNLLKFFNDEQIEIIAQACEDHRASSKNPPRSIYGKIVSDADRSDSVKLENLLKRVWLFNNDDYKNLSDDALFKDMYDHMVKKYGIGGYAKFILPETIKLLGSDIKRTRHILKNKGETYKIFLKMRTKRILKRKGE